MADTPTSLIWRAWGAVISLLGIAVTLAVVVSIIQSIWPWLAAIALVVVTITGAVLAAGHWRERGRW